MNFKKKVLPNGIRLLTIPMKDTPTVTVMVLVEAGSKYETKETNGISHFLEHMCFKGTASRPKAVLIARELDSIGALYNAFTAQEFTGYYAKSDFKHLQKLLDVVSDMYLHPTLPEAEIEKEKGVIIEEINMYEDMPQRRVQDLFMELLYGDQPAGWNVAGTKDVVKKLTRGGIAAYRARHYVGAATAVVIAGRFDEAAAAEAVGKLFGEIGTGEKDGKPPVAEAQQAPRVLLQYKETDQTHLVLGVRTFGIFDPRNPILRVLYGVLGGGMSSRLFQKLRDEMGVCYYVSASNDAYTDHGAFEVAAGVDSKRAAEAVGVILAELSRLAAEEVPAAELRKAKDFLIGSLYLGLESSDELAEFYGIQEILRKPLKTPEQAIREIEAVSAGQLQELSRSIFRNENLNLSIIGRFRDEAPFAQALSF